VQKESRASAAKMERLRRPKWREAFNDPDQG
jgi:hypothetical protein